MRKELFALIIAAVFSAGMLIGTTTLANADNTGTDKQTLKKLQMISKLLSKVDNRLEQVLQGTGTNPDQPTIAQLLQIKTAAQTIVTRVDQKLPTPVPTPPPDIG
ncbi:MAG: hypothetical protein ACREAU_02680 [Nitrosopumilaceae archaeon]